MGLFGRKKNKALPTDIKVIKRKYQDLKNYLEREPHKFSQADFERLANYENELIQAGVLQPTTQPTQQPQLPAHPGMPNQPTHPAQMPYQQGSVEQVTTKERRWGDANKNENFIEEEHRINLATGEEKKIVCTVTTVCGKVLSADKVAGFCKVCDRAVCHDHAKYCEGYENIVCGLIICPQHIQIFKDPEGKNIYCCPEHYQMRYFYQKV